MAYKLCSLFDGSGGFPLAGVPYGIEPVSASEIEPYPIAVTRSRFPDMVHLGDISTINGAEIEPVDIITFGSPCQDLSIAGKRAGLAGERSGLFMEAIRIIKEMRGKTNGRYPTFAIWENVAGAFSSNGGEDFRAVLEEFVRIIEPNATVPPIDGGRWPHADIIMGDRFSIAYRLFNAEHWGVPQRRRRIYLVADFRGQRAGKVLFERECLQGRYKSRRETWENITANIGKDTTGTSRENGKHGIKREVYENHGFDGRYNGPLSVCQTICANFGEGGNNKPIVIEIIENGNGTTREEVEAKYKARWLMPLECGRLQGFPDGWADIDHKEDMTETELAFWTDVRTTHAEIMGKQIKPWTKAQMLKWYNALQSDANVYKMWGNGIALPCALYVMEGIALALEEEEKEVADK